MLPLARPGSARSLVIASLTTSRVPIIALPRKGRLTNLPEEAVANTLVLAPSEIRSKKSSNDSCTRSFIMETRVRDIVEHPESVLVLPVGQKGTVLLIEEYDLGAET